MTEPALLHLAELWGVQPGYWDVSGQWHDVDRDALLVVLRELGAPIERPEDAAGAIDAHGRLLLDRPVEPVLVVHAGRTLGFVLRLPNDVGGDVEVEVTSEDGQRLAWVGDVTDVDPYDGGEVDGRRWSVRWMDTRLALPLGYHRATIRVGGRSSAALVLAPPHSLPQPARGPMWGVFAPSYAFVPTGEPGRDHLGIGHLGHLDDLGRRIHAAGGRVVSTLPLLATYLDDPFEPSPYSPVSRRWWSELHLDPARLPGLDESPGARELLGSTRVREVAADLASQRLVDHAAAARLVREVLDTIVADIGESAGPTSAAIADFGRSHPELARYARFRAMVEAHGPGGVTPVTESPPADLDPSAVARHRYVQYAVDAQMAELARSFRERDQVLALDLPLGASPDGFDVWSDPGSFATAATGAPPDDLFSGGQNWGFPPPHPVAGRERGHQELIAALRHHLRYTGLLRIDHLMSLERLWWIPDGFAPTQGVYVRYPTEELMAIVAIEASRAEAVVVGENLGTVTDEINEVMDRWGMLGMYELQFEPWHVREHGHLRRPSSRTVAGINTHDMPTFAGWWQGGDITINRELGFVDDEDIDDHWRQREVDRDALVRGLAHDLGVEVPLEPGPALRASLEWLGGGPAAVVLATLEDLWLEDRPQNVPGTHRELPNWRRKFDRPVATALTEPLAAEALAALDRARRSHAPAQSAPEKDEKEEP